MKYNTVSQSRIFESLLNMIRQYKEAEKLLDHQGMFLASGQLGTCRNVRVKRALQNGEISRTQYENIRMYL